MHFPWKSIAVKITQQDNTNYHLRINLLRQMEYQPLTELIFFRQNKGAHTQGVLYIKSVH